MEIRIDPIELQNRGVKLFLATPMYGGQCHGMYAKSCLDLASICVHMGIELQVHYLFNESLITRARNYCCETFLNSNCTHMIFIDSDIGFNPMDIIAMITLMTDESDYDVMTGNYPKKTIAWEKVVQAVDAGIGRENPTDLEKYVGDFVVNFKTDQKSVRIDEPCEIYEGGTGMMIIRRKTLEKITEAFPQYMYRPDHVRSAGFDGSKKIMQFFQAEIDTSTERYLSEDYWFSRKCQEIGMKIWNCPWISGQHCGNMIYNSTLKDLAMIGANATADPNQLKGMKK